MSFIRSKTSSGENQAHRVTGLLSSMGMRASAVRVLALTACIWSGTSLAQGTTETQVPSERPWAESGAVPSRPAPIRSGPETTRNRPSLSPDFIISGAGSQREVMFERDAGKMPDLGQVNKDTRAPWVLAAEQKPAPLYYSEPGIQTSLLLSLPTVNELRLYLPGQVLDLLDNARYAINKYLQDSMAVALAKRTEQLELVHSWINGIQDQQSQLPSAAWPQYQFTLEARERAQGFLDHVGGQSMPTVETVINSSQRAIDELSILMAAMPTQESMQLTYDLMVRLRDGVALFEEQLRRSDGQIERALEVFLSRNPARAVPLEAPPPQDGAVYGGHGLEPVSQIAVSGLNGLAFSPDSTASALSRASGTSLSATGLSAGQSRSLQPQPAQADVPVAAASSTLSSFAGLFIFGVAALGIWGWIKRARRKKPK